MVIGSLQLCCQSVKRPVLTVTSHCPQQCMKLIGVQEHILQTFKLCLALLVWKLKPTSPGATSQWEDYPVPRHGLLWRLSYRMVALLCCDVQTSPGHVTRQQTALRAQFSSPRIFEEKECVSGRFQAYSCLCAGSGSGAESTSASPSPIGAKGTNGSWTNGTWRITVEGAVVIEISALWQGSLGVPKQLHPNCSSTDSRSKRAQILPHGTIVTQGVALWFTVIRHAQGRRNSQ